MSPVFDFVIACQRWAFRRKQKKQIRTDINIRMNTIKKADKLSSESGKRLFVIKFAVCDYRIFAKPELKAIGRTLRLTRNINYYQTGDVIVHITKKPE